MRIVSARTARLLIGAAFLLVLGTSTASAAPLAANRIVTIQSFTFIPSTITVNVGDTVSWTNTDPVTHSAKSTTGAFDTGALAQGQGKTIVFSLPGTYPYVCAFHPTLMSGTIIVTGAATPTPPPTLPPTAPPTPVPTAPPTPQPTVAPTPTRTPTPIPSPSVTTSAPATASTTPAAPGLTATPSASASVVFGGGGGGPLSTAVVAAAKNDSAPGPLLVAGGAVLIVGLIGAAFVLLRR